MANIKFDAEVSNTTRLEDVIEDLSGRGGDLEKAVHAATQEAWTLIRERIARGVGYKGRFTAYSKSYKKERKEAGRSVSPPDLLFTGKMLNSFTTKVETGRNQITGVIFSQDSSQAEKIKSNDATRPFLGISQKVDRFFRDAIKEYLTNQLR